MTAQGIEGIIARANEHRLQGRLREACLELEQALAREADHGAAWKMLGDCRRALGLTREAADAYQRAAQLAPGETGVLTLLAQTRYSLGQHAEAAQSFAALTRAQPDNARNWYMLGTALAALGRPDDAAGAYRQALQRQPQHPDSLYGLGFLAYARHRYAEAAECFRSLLVINPRHAQAHNGLAATLQALGQYREALSHYDAALQIIPVYVDAHFGRGNTLIVLGDTEGAISSLREALRLDSRHAGAWISLASALMTLGKVDEALECCERALQITPQHPDATALAATIEQHAGKAGQAMERLQPLIEAGVRNINLVVAFAEVSKTLDLPGPAIELLERELAHPEQLPVTSRRNLHFNLGRLYDKVGRYAEAFGQYRQGNTLRPLEYDAVANRREIDSIIALHDTGFMAAAPHAGARSAKPVFVVGMPRSGTSLVEQILASHPAVHGAGELPDLWQMVARLPGMLGTGQPYPACMTALDRDTVDRLAGEYLARLDTLAPDAERVVDKMPGNFRFLGLIALLFPDAHVIHCRRDPVDTCLSCYFQDFSRSHAYSYDLEQLGAYYRDYRRLMEHWQSVLQIPVMDVRYEELVEDQEAVSRRLVEFIGLEWDDSCLDFHKTRRFVATASYDQVRRPLYRKSVARWKNYEPWIGPLIKALDDQA